LQIDPLANPATSIKTSTSALFDQLIAAQAWHGQRAPPAGSRGTTRQVDTPYTCGMICSRLQVEVSRMFWKAASLDYGRLGFLLQNKNVVHLAASSPARVDNADELSLT